MQKTIKEVKKKYYVGYIIYYTWYAPNDTSLSYIGAGSCKYGPTARANSKVCVFCGTIGRRDVRFRTCVAGWARAEERGLGIGEVKVKEGDLTTVAR